MGCGSSSQTQEYAGPGDVTPAAQPPPAQKYAVAEEKPQQQQQQPQQTKPVTEQSAPPPEKAKAKEKEKPNGHAPSKSVSPPPATPRELWHHTVRIVEEPITGYPGWSSYTGAGATFGFVKSDVLLSASHPVVDVVIVTVSISDGFLFGVSSPNSPLATVPGSVAGSLAWNPAKGTFVVNQQVVNTVTSIVPQQGDRITISLTADKQLRFELNDGLVANIPALDQMAVNFGLIGGGAVVLVGPSSIEEKQKHRSELVAAAGSFISHVKNTALTTDEAKKAMRKAQRKKAKEIDAAASALVEQAKKDPNMDPAKVAKYVESRENLKAIKSAEEERIMIRQVKLKLRALRSMWCPTRKATTMWRKCLVRAQERKAKGIARTPSIKAATAPSPKAASVQPILAPPAPVSVSAVTSSFRTVPKTKQLSETIFLDQFEGKVEGGLTQYEWIARNEQMDQLIIELDLSKCKGLDLHGEPIQKSHLKAYEHKLIAVVTQQSIKAGYSMSYGIACTTLPPDASDLKAASEADEKEISAASTSMEQVGLNFSAREIHKENIWETTVDLLKSKQLHFLDRSFPPVSDSVWTKTPSQLATLSLTWRRLFSFLPPHENPSFFEPQIDPNDIQQGRLGNCWFCSSLSAVAETPALVAKLFGRKQVINASGLYTVRLCLAGIWREIVLDDYFPCYPSAGPIFTKNHGSQLWVLFLEKAFAKVYGGYDKLISGQAHHALADLTGFPVKSYLLEDAESRPLLENNAEKLWQELMEGARQDLSMCAGTVGKENATDAINALLKSVGLVAGHAYSLLNCLEVPATAKTSAGTRLLELRNPWGNGEWQGDWSDNSPLWTDELKQLMNPKISSAVEDGLFYMQLSDFLKYFSSVSTCFIRSPKVKPWNEVRFPGEWISTAGKEDLEHVAAALPKHMYELEVKKESDVWAVMYQEDSRMPGATSMVDQAVMIIRTPTEGKLVEVICDTKIDIHRQTNVTARLQPGKYLIIPYTSGKRAVMVTPKSANRPFHLAVFADEASTTSSVKPIAFDAAIYTDVLLHLLRSSGQLDKFGKDQQLWMYQLRHGTSHFYACGIDPAYTKHFSVTLNSQSSVNAQTHRSDTACTRVVSPGQLLLYHHLTPVTPELPTSYNVDIGFKTHKMEK